MRATSTARRGPFDGVRQIMRFNWPYYVGGLIGSGVLIGLVAAVRPASLIAWLLFAAGIGGFGWLALTLAVSHYIYDRSDLYRWQWIRELVSRGPRHVVNIHAGLDETSVALQEMYPASELTILDIFDPEEMSEPSIARARREAGRELAIVSADFRALPLEPGSADLVTVIFVAHELRRREAKQAFFGEVARILKPGGRLLLVEHLRDLRNLVAFGPGAFHFFPRQEWLHAAQRARLDLVQEFPRTPFVRAFVFTCPEGDR